MHLAAVVYRHKSYHQQTHTHAQSLLKRTHHGKLDGGRRNRNGAQQQRHLIFCIQNRVSNIFRFPKAHSGTSIACACTVFVCVCMCECRIENGNQYKFNLKCVRLRCQCCAPPYIYRRRHTTDSM